MKMRDDPIALAVSKLSSDSIANNAKNTTEPGSAVVCAGMSQAATVSA